MTHVLSRQERKLLMEKYKSLGRRKALKKVRSLEKRIKKQNKDKKHIKELDTFGAI